MLMFYGLKTQNNMQIINLKDKLCLIHEQWTPHLIAEYSGMQVYLSKIQGEFILHKHDESDELFLVIKGTMIMCFEEQEISVLPGELIIVPQGILHCPRTENEEVHVLVMEKKGTTHTGDLTTERTVKDFKSI